MKLGLLIKTYRERNNIGLREMAREIGIDASSLSRIESGELPGKRSLVAVLIWLLKEE